jgi:5-formyltetrahydrofolate cyclo-ligase
MTERNPVSGGPSPSNHGDALAAAKHAARSEALSARSGLDSVARTHASAAACGALLALPELARVGIVLGYFALPSEIDPLEAVSALRTRGVTIGYPRVVSPGVLDVHLVNDERELVPGTFGLSEPPAAAPVLEPQLVDAVIVPGVAFGVNGERLGYGGGYYDRLLPRLRSDCVRIGFALDEQVLGEVPAEPHDALMDLLVTPTRVIRTSPARR